MGLMDHKARSERGQALQAEVCAEVVAAAATPFEESLRDFVYAEVWSRPGLDRRARYLVSLAGAVLAGADAELVESYARGALQGGHLSLRELREAALHLAVYGGWSRGRQLDRAVTAAADALGLPAADCPAIRGEDWDPEVRTREGMAEFTSVMTFPGGPSATPYLEAINNFVFGEMWPREGLDQRSRRWLTLVGVAESRAEIPIKSHFHAAMASGNCTPEEMREFVLAYGLCAGWPKASAVSGIVLEMIDKVEKGLPWHG